MKRREFITVLGGAAVAWPLAARAQQRERMRRIGVLLAACRGRSGDQARRCGLPAGLQQLGWSDGRNVAIEYRWAAGDAERSANMRPNWSRSRRTSSWPRALRRWRRCYRRPGRCRSCS